MHSPRSADRLLQELFVSKPQDIDLEAIAWLQGAKVKYRDLDGCEACLTGSAELGRAIISIDNRGHQRRRRFSLAHEIGHWEWHRGRLLICQKEDIGGSGRRRRGMAQERDANSFAAELLMPGFMLKDRLRDFRTLNMHAVRQLADAFDVSRTAMAYRLVEMDHEPSILVAYGKDGRRWFVSSKSIDERWFPRDFLDPQSNAYAILHKGARDDLVMSAVDADTWFDVPWADQIEIGEQSFRVSEDEVVSLLVARSTRMLAD